MSEGMRSSEGKPQLSYLDLYFPNALEAIAKVCENGASKYVRGNCLLGGEKLTLCKLQDSQRRHELAFFGKNQDNDVESELPHLAHAAWNALLKLEFFLSRPEQDDRIK